MANEEVLRLRTVVIPDNAGIRQVKQNILDLKNSGAGTFQAMTTGAQGLQRTLQGVNRDIGLLKTGLAAIGVQRMLVGFRDVAQGMLDLSRASKEMGLSLRELRGFEQAGLRMGIGSQAVVSSLRNVDQKIGEITLRTGDMLARLVGMGAGPVVAGIMRAATTADKFKEILKFKDTLLDRGQRHEAQEWLRTWGVDMSYLEQSAEDVAAAIAKIKPPSQAEIQRAKEFTSAWADMSQAFTVFKETAGVTIFPWLADQIRKSTADLEKFVQLWNNLGNRWSPSTSPANKFTPEEKTQRGGFVERGIPQFQAGGISTGGLAMLHGPEAVVPLQGGAIPVELKGSGQEGQRTVEEGTFQALVRWASYQQMGGGHGNLGGMGGGGVGGAGGGLGGGPGGSQPANSTTGDGRPAGSTVTPSAEEQMGQAMSKGKFPMDMQPLYQNKGSDISQALGGLKEGETGPGLHINAGETPSGAQLPGGGGGALQATRAKFAAELEKNPKLKQDLFDLAHAEVGGQGPQAKQAFMETVFNRAAARGQSLERAIHDPKYYPNVTKSKIGTGRGPAEEAHLASILGGSNVSRFATGNASGSVGFGGGPQTATFGKERFGIEGADRKWAAGMRDQSVTTSDAEKSGETSPQPKGATLPTGGDAGNVARGYERNTVKTPGEFNYAATGAFGGPGGKMASITLKNGKTVQVNPALAERYKGLFNELIDRGYKIDSIGGYNYRGKAGGGGLSMHAYGAAVDVNPGRNPFGGRTTDMPKDIKDLSTKYGMSWGGGFGDPMHFEPMAPALAAKRLAELQGRGGLPAVASGGESGGGDYSTKPRMSTDARPMSERGMTFGMSDDASAIDRANGSQTSAAQSSVNLHVESNGTAAKAKAETKGPAFADTQIRNQTQGQMTADTGAVGHGP